LARCDGAGWLHTLFCDAICDESLRRDFLLSMFLFLLLLILLLLFVNDIIIINIFNTIVIIIECNKSCQHHTHVCMYTLLLLLFFRNTTTPTHTSSPHTNQSLHLSCQLHFPFPLAPTMLVPPRLPSSAVSAALCSCSRPTCKCSACHSPLPCSHEHRTPAPPARPCTGQHFPAKTTRCS